MFRLVYFRQKLPELQELIKKHPPMNDILKKKVAITHTARLINNITMYTIIVIGFLVFSLCTYLVKNRDVIANAGNYMILLIIIFVMLSVAQLTADVSYCKTLTVFYTAIQNDYGYDLDTMLKMEEELCKYLKKK